jgi:hypothetical protein
MGHLHPLTIVREDTIDFFRGMGFELAEAREVDHEWYNFEALNIPPEHPARDMHDTFYVDDGIVLRTHTSNVQAHYLLNREPGPVRMLAPGCVYRVDNDPILRLKPFDEDLGTGRHRIAVPAVADQRVRSAALDCPLLFLAGGRGHFDVQPRMRVAELHSRDDAFELDRPIDVELGCERMVRDHGRGRDRHEATTEHA